MVPIHTLDIVELFFNCCSILINCTVIHSFGMAGGMAGDARRGRWSSEYVGKIVFTLSSHDERSNCYIRVRKEIAREGIATIHRIPNS